MHPHDAQSALDDINRLQGRTRDEIVHHYFALPYVLLSALIFFITYASFDFPRPWHDITMVVGLGLWAATAILQRRRSSVRRKSPISDLELVFYIGWGLAFAGLFFAFRLGAEAVGLPFHNTIGAAAAAAVWVLAIPPSRRILTVIMNRNRGS
ncbi:hypothetical protein [Nonomuraea sediminis]|uniref:hypothetical protein n=1 Tax=Nonomuraea sediminis TaxID=2835864 RepID=UPI001BDCE233|nr:hypothetical protein [Nonomuraea sediminis]